ncbi:hypothetical protein CI109_102737 [Kwoniella shandongensis]|uniref:FAD dependent oxidoreductase domain-containing protein n=1 Tax=Kwoniella shandongensis TaxID=1734106 RepID=A0A5M6BV49_9TREE|nr:uncharacterized protein CI109_004940 [Kwoniella shandongensis]KAA5526737.1 hypothetical protein CI109_004940 [Kwoniella shandongensis]
MSASTQLPDLPPVQDRIVIIGSGIVGSCLASILSTRLAASSSSRKVILVDRDIHSLPGSTGHAPGFVGQYNSLPVLTELAKRSVKHYLGIEGGFQQVGGLEVGTGLEGRCEDAKKVGLEAKLLDKQQVLDLAPGFVRPDTLANDGPAGLFFPLDGTANAKAISHNQQSVAKANGAILLNADVTTITPTSTSTSSHPRYVLETTLGQIETSTLVLCTGIWASQLLPSFRETVVSVSHPYSYSIEHASRSKTPFIRWPASHVYARDHGTADGLGSYNHDPIKVSSEEIASSKSAYGRWEDSFDQVLRDGYDLLPDDKAATFQLKEGGQAHRFNGIFSVTPDGLPLVGQDGNGLYAGVGVWVTHAAGSAGLLADMILGEGTAGDEELRKALDPRRFDGLEPQQLEKRALGKYNDIYNKEG